jgi:hypothetical protein
VHWKLVVDRSHQIDDLKKYACLTVTDALSAGDTTRWNPPAFASKQTLIQSRKKTPQRPSSKVSIESGFYLLWLADYTLKLSYYQVGRYDCT